MSSHPRTPPRPDVYRRVAEVYDRVYAWKDYVREGRRIPALVRRYALRPARSLLDVGCGTGAHLRALVGAFDLTGLDDSGPMLRVARARVPEARLIRGRMEDFQLRRRFDVVTCLFSAIGYVRSPRDLDRTIANFAAHLEPGGVAIVEPWLSPGAYRVGSFHLGTYGSKEAPIARMNASERKGDRSIMDMHYLVATPRGVRHWVERHDMGLFPDRAYRRAFERAGLRCVHLSKGFTFDRGLYVGIRPLDGPVPRRTATAGSRSSPRAL